MIRQREFLIKPILALLAIGMLTLAITGCVISPRRIVDNSGSPSPTPTDTPTATPTPSATPTASPAATASGASSMSATTPGNHAAADVVPNRVPEFLFVAEEASSSLRAFSISGDGALIPATGSPFPVGDQPHRLLSSGNSLIVAGTSSLIVFQVDRASGALRQTDSVGMHSPQILIDPPHSVIEANTNGETTRYHLVNGHLDSMGSAPASPQSSASLKSPVIAAGSAPGIADESTVIDATNSFAYALISTTGHLDAFKLSRERKLSPLSPASYPAGSGAMSIAIVAP